VDLEQPDGTANRDDAEGRLDSWKEIARHLGRTVRTAQRWEKQESLPVHRHRHNRQATVFAYRTEIDRWLQDRADTAGVAKPPRRGRYRLWIAALGSTAIVALVTLQTVRWLTLRVPEDDARSVGSLAFEEPDQTSASSIGASGIVGAEYKLITSRLAASNPRDGRLHDFSPDGSQLIRSASPTPERKERFPDLLHELYVSDASASIDRALIEDAEGWEFIGDPRWSPNGLYILYTVSREKPFDRRLMLLDAHTQRSRLLAEALGPEDSQRAAWMPDSSACLVESSDGFRLIDLDGGVKRHFATRLDHSARLGNVSPDGRHLIYHRLAEDKEDRSEMDLWRLDLESGELSEVSDDPGFEGWPVWSRDGQHIYYISGPESARNVFRRTPDSPEPPVRVTSYSNGSVTHPMVLPESGQLTFVFMKDDHVIRLADTSRVGEPPQALVHGSSAMLSPDGGFVYYVDSEPGRVGLWRISVGGDDPQQLVSGTVLTSYGPKTLLSPDGSSIAYAQHIGDMTSLFVMPSSGGANTELYSTRGIRHLIPSWAPDGEEVAFAVAEDLMVVPSDGGHATVLASAQRWDSWSLEWSPDGRSIAALAWLEGQRSNVVLVIERDSKRVKRVTPESEGRFKEILAWHPHGDRISYMYYDPEDSNGSRVATVDHGQVSDLADMPDPMWDYIGTWGPDGRYYFVSTVRGPESRWGLYAFDVALNEYETVRQLSDGSVSLPSWTRDGKRMAWTETDPVRQLWMLTDYE
jgi:Tol biopolymer transport system component